MASERTGVQQLTAQYVTAALDGRRREPQAHHTTARKIKRSYWRPRSVTATAERD